MLYLKYGNFIGSDNEFSSCDTIMAITRERREGGNWKARKRWKSSWMKRWPI
jgi:hypothetical protein